MIFFRALPVTESDQTPTKPQIQPLSKPLKKLEPNILSEAAVIERLDWTIERKNSLVRKPQLYFTKKASKSEKGNQYVHATREKT